MFNATNLLKQWNQKSGMKKEVRDFFELKQTKAFVEILMNEELFDTRESAYLATRGKQGGTWMHPILFVKFAIWINPKLEYFVIRFMFDQLIESQHSAGDQYRGLTKALTMFDNVDYDKVAKGLNYIVFGIHEKELKQKATQQQLKSLTNLQEELAFAIDMGYIKSFDELITEMRKIWRIKDQYLAL